MNHKLTIAIDGPVGSGKGTLAVALSQRLGILYLYTGGMYRGLTLACLRRNINLEAEQAVLEVLQTCNLRLDVSTEGTKIYLGDDNITDTIVHPEVSNATPIAAAHPKVREEMVKRQRAIVEDQSAVIEGRDISTAVAPDANIKIFLTASLESRAKRRYQQFQEKGIQKTYEEVLEDTKLRDKRDEERDVSPLEQTSDAVVIDTTGDTIDQTIGKVITLLKERNLYDSY